MVGIAHVEVLNMNVWCVVKLIWFFKQEKTRDEKRCVLYSFFFGRIWSKNTPNRLTHKVQKKTLDP